MGLRAQAESDLRKILGDTQRGFGWPVIVANPEGVCVSMTGFSNDIAETIDPETGQAVSGRVASVALSMKDLENVDRMTPFGFPAAISDQAKRPWVVVFDDILGCPHTFKVNESKPDRAIGLITMTLETYNKDPSEFVASLNVTLDGEVVTLDGEPVTLTP